MTRKFTKRNNVEVLLQISDGTENQLTRKVKGDGHMLFMDTIISVDDCLLGCSTV
jgi:hypothetical protein